jgi:hypothetical protein
MATATRPDLAAAQRSVGALAEADRDAIRALLAPDVQMRALVPFLTVADGRLTKINSVCSGFQPAGSLR